MEDEQSVGVNERLVLNHSREAEEHPAIPFLIQLHLICFFFG
jgi:hypothetical protein